MVVYQRHHLTQAEEEVLDLVANLYGKFAALPECHHSDHDEVAHHLHAIQKVVGARVAYRTNPERFPVRQRSPSTEHRAPSRSNSPAVDTSAEKRALRSER